MSSFMKSLKARSDLDTKIHDMDTAFLEDHPDFDSELWEMFGLLDDSTHEIQTYWITEQEDGGFKIGIEAACRHEHEERTFWYLLIKDGQLVSATDGHDYSVLKDAK